MAQFTVSNILRPHIDAHFCNLCNTVSKCQVYRLGNSELIPWSFAVLTVMLRQGSYVKLAARQDNQCTCVTHTGAM